MTGRIKRAIIHELKTDGDVFQAVVNGVKTFEIRRDDRGFGIGHVLRLRETVYTGEEMKAGAPLEYTGRDQAVVATYILRGPRYGLVDGWVIMSVQRILMVEADSVEETT